MHILLIWYQPGKTFAWGGCGGWRMSKSVIHFLVTWTTLISKFSSTRVGYAILREILRIFKSTELFTQIVPWFDLSLLHKHAQHTQGQIGWYRHKNIITQPVVSFKSSKIQKKFLKLSYAELAYLDWIRLSSSRETQRKLMEKEATYHF